MWNEEIVANIPTLTVKLDTQGLDEQIARLAALIERANRLGLNNRDEMLAAVSVGAVAVISQRHEAVSRRSLMRPFLRLIGG